MMWLTLAIRTVLNENKFQTYTLDEGDNLTNLVKNFLISLILLEFVHEYLFV